MSDDSKLSEIRLRHGVMPASAGEVAFQADADRDYLLKMVDELQTRLKKTSEESAAGWAIAKARLAEIERLQTLLANERSSPVWGAIGKIAAAVDKPNASVADVVAEVKRLKTSRSTVAVRAYLPGGTHEGLPYDCLDARHTIEQVGDDAIVYESWHNDDGSEKSRETVRLPVSELVHIVLNMTAEERAEANARADSRGAQHVAGSATAVNLTGGDRVVTAAKLQEEPNCALACGQEQRKPGAHGMIDFEINPEDGGGFQVVHDDGTQAPYAADELTPETSNTTAAKDILGTPEFWTACAEATFARVTPSRLAEVLAEVKGKTDEQVHAELVASGHVPDPACVLREMVHDYERVGDYGDGLVLRNCLQAHADNGMLPDDELTGLMLADYEARYRAAEVALWHKHKDAEARPTALDPDAPGLDDMTRKRRIALRRITEMTDTEIHAALVRAGIYTPEGELTPHYRDDAEPSASRPTSTMLDEYNAIIAAASKGAK